MAKKTLRTAKEAITPRSTTNVSVRIEEATNGFMVSSWVKDKEIRYIAKTKKEAMAYATKIFEKY